jgi:ribose transport system permease protein
MSLFKVDASSAGGARPLLTGTRVGMSTARGKEIAIGALVLVVAVMTLIKSPAFLQPYNLHNLLQRIGMFGIFSIGMGLIIITGGIDLSVGSVFALEGVFLSLMVEGGPWPAPFMFLRQHPWPWPLACLAVIGITTLIGWFHGAVVTRIKLQPFIVTLCGYLWYRSLARTVVNDQTQGFSSPSSQALKHIVNGNFLGLPASFVALIIVAVVVGILLHRSIWGRYLYAVGRNEEAARYSGINSNRMVTSAYVVGGIIAGISGIFIAIDSESVAPATHATAYELYAIAAAVLGGCSFSGGEGSVIGIVLGTTLLILLRNMVNLFGAPTSTEGMVMATVIFLGALVDQLLTNRRKKAKVVFTEPAASVPPGVHSGGGTASGVPADQTKSS